MEPKPEANGTMMNSTGFGYPEISYYLKDFFLKQVEPVNETYKEVKFERDLALRLLNYSRDLGKLVKREDTLLHWGNLNSFYAAGVKFNQTNDPQSFKGVKEQFKFESVEQTRVVWGWLDYLVQNTTRLSN